MVKGLDHQCHNSYSLQLEFACVPLLGTVDNFLYPSLVLRRLLGRDASFAAFRSLFFSVFGCNSSTH